MNHMKQQNCTDFSSLLDAWLDGDLSQEDADSLQEHLSVCPDCQVELQIALKIREAFPKLEETEVPVDFAAGVMAEIHRRSEQGSSAKTSSRIKLKWVTRTLPVLAACLALAIVLWALPMQKNTPVNNISSDSSGNLITRDAVPETRQNTSDYQDTNNHQKPSEESENPSKPPESKESSKTTDSPDLSKGSDTSPKHSDKDKEDGENQASDPALASGPEQPEPDGNNNSAENSPTDIDSNSGENQEPIEDYHLLSPSSMPPVPEIMPYSNDPKSANENNPDQDYQPSESVPVTAFLTQEEMILLAENGCTVLSDYAPGIPYDDGQGITGTEYILSYSDFSLVLKMLNRSVPDDTEENIYHVIILNQ